MKAKLIVFLASLAVSLGTVRGISAEVSDKDFAAAMDKYLKTEAGQQAVGTSIENYFQAKQRDAQKKQEDQVAAELESQFSNPVKIDIGASPVKGPANAKITVIEFSDFQCPFCSRGHDTMDQLMKAYPNDVKLVFKNMPLPFHEQAAPAAKAAWAAGKQGKFWEYHDALFANQKSLSPEFYIQQATTLGLNLDKFKADMNSADAEAQIKADRELGEKNGISGTPGFFVNGVAVRGAYPLDHFKKIVDRWLAQK